MAMRHRALVADSDAAALKADFASFRPYEPHYVVRRNGMVTDTHSPLAVCASA